MGPQTATTSNIFDVGMKAKAQKSHLWPQNATVVAIAKLIFLKFWPNFLIFKGKKIMVFFIIKFE